MKIERIVFIGTPEFAVPSLVDLVKNDYKPLLCVSQPDKPKGRKRKLLPTPVKSEAINNDIPVFQPENINSPESVEKILSYKPQLIITVAYGGFIGKKLRKTPNYGAINLHPSLLPKYRGSSPINYALFNSDKVTGNTIFRLIAKMDAGPILYQHKIEIKPEDNFTSLSDKLAYIGAKDILKVIKMFENNTVNPIPQDEKLASYTQKIEKEDLLLDFNKTALKIISKIRGLAVKPAAHTFFRGRMLKIIEAIPTDVKSVLPFGSVVDIIKNSGIRVATKDYDIIITKVQPAGKKIMSAFDFNLGARIQSGEKFEKR